MRHRRVICRKPSALVRSALPAMTGCQSHRGPDDSGESVLPFGNKFLGFGHRRLAILDLSAAGHQPMVNPTTGDQIVFNGEIYNFASLRRELEGEGVSFVGHCDTEVMLHALSRWGPEAVRKFQGMYAFAFYNAREQSLLLARDPLGIKPLYVAQMNGMLIFASEVRAILASGLVLRKIDHTAVAGLLAFACVQRPQTLVENVAACFARELIRCSRPTATARHASRRCSGISPAGCGDPRDRCRAPRGSGAGDGGAGSPGGRCPGGGVSLLRSGQHDRGGPGGQHHPRIRSFTVGFADQPHMSEAPMAARDGGVIRAGSHEHRDQRPRCRSRRHRMARVPGSTVC